MELICYLPIGVGFLLIPDRCLEGNTKYCCVTSVPIHCLDCDKRYRTRYAWSLASRVTREPEESIGERNSVCLLFSVHKSLCSRALQHFGKEAMYAWILHFARWEMKYQVHPPWDSKLILEQNSTCGRTWVNILCWENVFAFPQVSWDL